ncbi:hypothetical protein HDU92_004247 [Lobulomyces angularis]|nr:hypothetical protein HDU92_004247 [Lobulomyces angularis]
MDLNININELNEKNLPLNNTAPTITLEELFNFDCLQNEKTQISYTNDLSYYSDCGSYSDISSFSGSFSEIQSSSTPLTTTNNFFLNVPNRQFFEPVSYSTYDDTNNFSTPFLSTTPSLNSPLITNNLSSATSNNCSLLSSPMFNEPHSYDSTNIDNIPMFSEPLSFPETSPKPKRHDSNPSIVVSEPGSYSTESNFTIKSHKTINISITPPQETSDIYSLSSSLPTPTLLYTESGIKEQVNMTLKVPSRRRRVSSSSSCSESEGGGFQCTFPGCSKSFTKNTALKSHTISHSTEKKHVCPCGSAFLRLHDLKRHKQNIHKPKDSKCVICTKVFGDVDTYKKHLGDVHKIVGDGLNSIVSNHIVLSPK